MNKVEILDKAIAHFSKPGAQLGFWRDCPYYLTPHGHPCVIGCLLSDARKVEEISTEHHSFGIRQIFEVSKDQGLSVYQDILSILPSDESERDGIAFLFRLQKEHDAEGMTVENLLKFLKGLREEIEGEA